MSYKNKNIQYTIVTISLIGLLFSFTPIAARLPNQIAQFFSGHHHPDTDRFTRIGTEWPPQPKQIKNVTWLLRESNNQITDKNIGVSGSAAMAGSLSNEDVSELGDRFTFVSTQKFTGKNSQSTHEIMTFFSHSNNTTVEVQLLQGERQNVTTISPSSYQPPLTEEEVKEAVNIARESLLQDGFDRIQQLDGYGILAFKPSSEATSEPGGFYDTRVAYVSFHDHIDARPEFIAWVDLSEQTVIKSGEDSL